MYMRYVSAQRAFLPGSTGNRTVGVVIMMEKIIYNGHTYSRNSEAKDLSHRKYYRRSWNKRPKNGEKLLHRQIWFDNFGPIPFMCVIHHIDGNPDNNDIENLCCVSERDHSMRRVPSKARGC